MSNTTVTNNTTTGATEVHDIAPGALLVDRNVRLAARVDADFVASVRELGVLVPIVAVRTSEGALRVRFGHRRTAAALEAGRASVPVVVVADEATDDAAEVERLVTQWAENEHRTGLSTAERVTVISQLAAFGVSAAKIAKRTRTKRGEVDAALAVAGSELARAATVRCGDLDLVQAAVVAEFEDDPEAVEALVAAAGTGQFDHAAQRLRDARTEAQRRATIAAELEAAGVPLVDRPSWDSPVKALAELRSNDGERFTPVAHASCPGHAAFIGTMHGWVDPTTGAAVEDDEDETEDEDTQRSQDGGDEAEDRPEPVWSSYLTAFYVCTDPKGNGHRMRGGYDSGSERPLMAQMSEAEREAARAQRRDVIDSNRAWASAETVRRQWLASFATRKTPPKGASAWVAEGIARDASLIADVGGNRYAADLLGCEHDGYGRSVALAQLAGAANEARAQVITLVQILAAYEQHTDRNDWRSVRATTVRYLRYLESLGYVLADVERRACGENPLPTVDDTDTNPET